MRLVAAGRIAWPARLSRDAGRYLCNYAYWQALARAPHAQPLIQFVHIPPLRRSGLPRTRVRRHAPTLADLVNAGEAILIALVAGLRR
jgi:pyroglutamyl-peptidase